MKWIVCLLLIVLSALDAGAQAPVKQKEIRAVLVMLRTERKKIQYYRNSGKGDKANRLRDEMVKVNRATINDFSAHFDRWPVYYFVDSNLSDVRQGKLDGHILDKNLQPLTIPPVNFADNNYIIVYYGKPPADVGVQLKDGDKKPVYTEGYHPGNGLVVLGPSFERMKNTPLFFIYTARVRKDREKLYNYISDEFDVEYREYAKDLKNRTD